MSLLLVHVELAEANAFVDALHRHHKRVVGHKFSLGAIEEACECGDGRQPHSDSSGKISERGGCTGCSMAQDRPDCIGWRPKARKLVGVAIVGRPVARRLDDGETLEVTRLCTDGTPNACSFLYGACRRAAFALGYGRIGTYTLQDEGGASLRAAGWTLIGERSGGNWKNREGRAIESTPDKLLWASP